MLTTYQKLWDLFDRRGRLGLLALLLVMLLAALVEALAIVAVVPFLSALKGDSAALPGAWARLAVGGEGGLPAMGVALAFVVLVVLAIALKAVADYAAMAFSAAQSARWSRRLLRVHLNRDYDWFLGQHSANIGYGLLARVQEVVVNSLLPALRIIVSAMVVGCILAVLVPAAPAVIFLVAAALMAAYSLVFMLLRRRFATLGVEKEQIGALRFRLVGELFAGIKEVKLHGLEAAYHDATREPFRRFAALISQRHLFSVLPRYVLEALGFAALALAVLVLGRREAGLDGVLPLLGLLGFAAFRLLPAVQQVYGNAVSLPMGVAALEALHENLAGGDDAVPAPPAPIPLRQSLQAVDACYAYPDTPHVSAMRLFYFAKAMAARGHQVILLTGESPAQPGQGLPAHEVAAAVATHDWSQPLVIPVCEQESSAAALQGSATLPSPLRRLRTAWRLLAGNGIHGQWVRNARSVLAALTPVFQPDLVWTTFGNTSNLQLGQALSRRVGCPWVADIKDNWREFIPQGLRHAVAWRFRDVAGLTFNAVLHKEVASAWRKTLPAAIVYSGVSEAFFVRAGEESRTQHQDVLLVGSTYSSVHLQKYLSALAQWMDAMPAADREQLRFVYAGSDVQRVNAGLLATPLPCATLVMAQRPVAELAHMTQRSLLSSYIASDKGFHHKLLELLVAGRPVVCYPSEHPESVQLAASIETGFYVCPDTTALIMAFTSAWQHPIAARQSPQPPAWRWDDMAEGLDAFFASIMNKESPPVSSRTVVNAHNQLH